MVVRLDLSPGDLSSFRRSFSLGGVVIVLWCYWHDRTRRWHVEMRSPAGRVLALPQQASPGGVYTTDPRDPDTPPGVFVWGPGPEPYTRAQLGDGVDLYYAPPEDTPATDIPDLIKRTE